MKPWWDKPGRKLRVVLAPLDFRDLCKRMHISLAKYASKSHNHSEAPCKLLSTLTLNCVKFLRHLASLALQVQQKPHGICFAHESSTWSLSHLPQPTGLALYGIHSERLGLTVHGMTNYRVEQSRLAYIFSRLRESH